MSARERILTIRLMDMAGKQPEYMAAFEIEVVPNRKEPDLAEKPGGAVVLVIDACIEAEQRN